MSSFVMYPTITNSLGEELYGIRSIVIPDTLFQSGIIDDYINYSYMYGHWKQGTSQYKLSRIWKEQGYSNARGVATIGGYYCVSVTSRYGNVGDMILICLEDETMIPAIICDITKCTTNSNYGTVKTNNKVSIIKWGRVKTNNGEIVTSAVRPTQIDKCEFTNWCNKKILNIINYGQYASLV